MQNILGKSNFIMGKVKVVDGQFDRDYGRINDAIRVKPFLIEA